MNADISQHAHTNNTHSQQSQQHTSMMTRQSGWMNTVTIAVLGAANTGKTSLIAQFVSNGGHTPRIVDK
jgi:GTPase SAR1 family protein